MELQKKRLDKIDGALENLARAAYGWGIGHRWWAYRSAV